MNKKASAPRRRLVAGGAITLASASLLAATPAQAADSAAATAKVLDHHLGAFANGLDALMQDYTQESVILSHDKQFRGVEQIRGFFDAFLKGVKPGFWEAFRINAKAIDRDLAYLVWEARPFVAMATDTFVVRGGRIRTQTFTMA